VDGTENKNPKRPHRADVARDAETASSSSKLLSDSEVQSRFWAKVQKTDGCWLWTGCRSRQGYGRFKIDGVMKYAHRIAYEWLRGPFPEGRELDHLCLNPSCVNPEHLEVVSKSENRRRAHLQALRRRHRGAPPDPLRGTYFKS